MTENEEREKKEGNAPDGKAETKRRATNVESERTRTVARRSREVMGGEAVQGTDSTLFAPQASPGSCPCRFSIPFVYFYLCSIPPPRSLRSPHSSQAPTSPEEDKLISQTDV
jgi:hypothetical protein